VLDLGMAQMNFSEFEYANKKRKTRKEVFLEKMNRVVPMARWCEIIRPFYYENGSGRQPIELETMLRMYLVGNWFNMSDEATEDALYDSMAIKNFVGGTPDATTLCKFRKILEHNRLTKKIFEEQNKLFNEQGLILHEGTIVDATIIESPKKTEGGYTRKNERRYYGTKAHLGVDKKTGYIHSVFVTPANVQEVTVAQDILHGNELEVYGDAGYIGIEKREDICTKFNDGTGEVEYITNHSHKKRHYYVLKKREINFYICPKQSKKTNSPNEQTISKIRKKVEHAFCKLKFLFGYRRTRYRTLSKNTAHLYTMFTLVNLSRAI